MNEKVDFLCMVKVSKINMKKHFSLKNLCPKNERSIGQFLY